MEDKNMFLRYDPAVDDISVLRDCISEGYDVNSWNIKTGSTILAKAICFNKLDVVNELFKSEKLDIRLGGCFGLTPLHIACIHGCVEIAEVLLQKGINVDSMDTMDYTPLHYAIEHDRKEIVSVLVKHKCNVNFIYDDSDDINHDYRPLHITARDNKLDIVKELLKSNTIEINCIGRCGYTPLHLAVLNDHVEMVQLLISGENEAHPNFLDHKGFAPIHYAIEKNHIDIVQKLIALTVVDVNFSTSRKNTLLHIACNQGNLDIVQILLEKNSKVNAIGEYGYSPLHYVAINGCVNIVEELLKYKCDVSLKDKRENTPLHLAVINNNIDTIKCLVKNGADIDARNFDNKTPLEIAQICGQHAISQLLFELEFLKKKMNEILKY